MRNIILFIIMLVLNTISYAKIGRHNLQINVGGVAFTTELGYLLHSVRQSGTIHGFDPRGNFSMSFVIGDVYTDGTGSQFCYFS
ncbi:MAG: hypothetical protein ACRCTQ_06405 [Brevinemataceae bacterium]